MSLIGSGQKTFGALLAALLMAALTACGGGGSDGPDLGPDPAPPPPPPQTYTLSVGINGEGGITDSSGQISCTASGGACSGQFASGAYATITASPAANSRFTGWEGDCASAGTSTLASVPMTADRRCTARFAAGSNPQTYTLTASVTGNGSVSASPGKISACTATGGVCSDSYATGTAVTLAAAPAQGNSFTGWGGDCTAVAGTPTSATVTMSAARSCTAAFTANGPAPQQPPLAPANIEPAGTVVLGAYTRVPNKDGQTGIAYRESQLGRKYGIHQRYYNWKDAFPTDKEASDHAQGVCPLITWNIENVEDVKDLANINNGSQDDVIKQAAARVKAFGKPILLRWGAEMNGNWHTWSEQGDSTLPGKYVAAWKRIHGIFASSGVTNVSWVWSPNVESVPNVDWNNWKNYYPGDDYVDWVGIDGYNWGTVKGNTWKTFSQIIQPANKPSIYNDYAGKKPIMIAETSSAEAGGNKAAWLAETAGWIKSQTAIRAVVWFDSDHTSSGSGDWNVDSSPASLNAYKAAFVQDSYFQGRFSDCK